MKSFSSLLAVSAILSLAWQGTSEAREIALSFELEPTLDTQTQPEISQSGNSSKTSQSEIPKTDPNAVPLPIPPHGANPPVSKDSGNIITAKSYGGSDAIALAQTNATATAKMLPPPPKSNAQTGPSESVPATTPTPKDTPQQTVAVALTFDLGAPQNNQPTQVAATESISSPQTANSLENEKSSDPQSFPAIDLFEGGNESLVARVVGSAEGTRTPDGQITAAYFGHSDPGNGVWNMGTFSYQHGAKTPEEADQKQLKRLQSQTQVLLKKAGEKEIELTLEEKLNGIDLANQSPLAAIGRVGYIDRLAEARKMQLVGEEAIIWARTRSYINPDTNRWNAPGLGNTAESIRRDQSRRVTAIRKTLESYQAQNPDVFNQPQLPVSNESTSTKVITDQATSEDNLPEQLWDDRLSSDNSLAPTDSSTLNEPASSRQSAESLDDSVPTSRIYAPSNADKPLTSSQQTTSYYLSNPQARNDVPDTAQAGIHGNIKPTTSDFKSVAEEVDSVITMDLLDQAL